jgi:hypothetical protein
VSDDSLPVEATRRVVIDLLSGFELAVAPTFRKDFGESLYQVTEVSDSNRRFESQST